jgi:hypothetical protein
VFKKKAAEGRIAIAYDYEREPEYRHIMDRQIFMMQAGPLAMGKFIS